MKMNWSGLVFQNEDQTKLENAVVGNCFGLISQKSYNFACWAGI